MQGGDQLFAFSDRSTDRLRCHRPEAALDANLAGLVAAWAAGTASLVDPVLPVPEVRPPAFRTARRAAVETVVLPSIAGHSV